jgi:hypothetical protein
MTNKEMYFGTRERMTWVKAPASNPDISKIGWTSLTQFLNGGASVRSSSTAHKEYNLSWNLASSSDVSAVSDYADGVYGDGLIYFLDPFSMDQNVLPQYWAAPRLAVTDAPTFNGSDIRPTLVATATNTLDYPTKSAVYTFAADDEFASLWVPIPAGYTFHFGAHGSQTGTTTITLTPDVGSVVSVPPISVTTSNRVNTTISGTTGVTISFAGVGTLTLAGLIAQVLPTGRTPDTGGFISGRGHSGCRFSGSPSIQGYSAPQALDYQALSVTLVETGAWE